MVSHEAEELPPGPLVHRLRAMHNIVEALSSFIDEDTSEITKAHLHHVKEIARYTRVLPEHDPYMRSPGSW